MLLQIPDNCQLTATVHLADQVRIEAELFPTAMVKFEWPIGSDLDVKSVIRKTATAYTKANSLTYRMITSSSHVASSEIQEHLKSTTLIVTHAKTRTSEKGEPIPSSLPYASIHVADSVYSIITDNGVDFSVLKNGEEVAGKLPSEGFALGTMFSYVVPELAQKGSAAGDQSATSELTKDFIYAVAQTLVEGGELGQEAQRLLSDFVELATNKEFSVDGGDVGVGP